MGLATPHETFATGKPTTTKLPQGLSEVALAPHCWVADTSSWGTAGEERGAPMNRDIP